MAQFADSLVPRIRAILSSADLSTISAKGVRKQLVAQGYDEATIKENRKEIDSRISAIYESLTNPAPTAHSSPDEPIASSSRPNSSQYPPQTSQPVPLYDIKPSVKRERTFDQRPTVSSSTTTASVKAETDAQMAARLQAEFDAAQQGRSSRASAASGSGSGTAPKKKKKAVVKRKADTMINSDGEEVPKKRKGGGGGAFNKELILSDTLSALVNEPRLSRPQTVKRIWDYVKARDLQDPSDKRYILCDGPLKAVFHTDRLHMFTMNKILAEHFMDPAEIVGGEETQPKMESTGASAVKAELYGHGNGHASGSGHASRPVPSGQSAEIVYTDEEDEEDDY